MKKQVLNHFIVGVLALLTVVGLQSFTNDENHVETKLGQSCTDVIWYKVSVATSVACLNYQSISTGQLELHDANTSNPLIDMENFNLSTSEAEDEFNCLEDATFTCAVAYPADSENFDEIDGKWVPTTTPVCAICRP